ncbi:DUF6470 family protein [Falsibacillus pallidus]|uniref:YviE n=1 Tax=Falsibacillus pallidus TaxID=493781 RepID=A0A370G8I8_9BACI|nr:DUF6470 family protein [Falsibacillus pallidus]RDI40118.1 hypothetical protein DFR59_11234 [Falsibacillus pallidus]
MNIPQIRIQSQSAKIAMETSAPVQTIEQPHAQMQLHQENAHITMETIKPRLTIDQSQAWADMNLKSVFRMNAEAAQRSEQEWFQEMAESSQEGDELMMIEHGGNVMAAQAERHGELPTYDFNIGYIPSNFSVKVHFEPGRLYMDVTPQKVVNNTQVRKPYIDSQRGHVSIGMRQQANLQIDFVNLQV